MQVANTAPGNSILQQPRSPSLTFHAALHHVACALACCRLLKSTKDYELRIYDVYPFATTPYERRDEGFLALGSYMEGRNSESARMNLTQPIVMRYEPATVRTNPKVACCAVTLAILWTPNPPPTPPRPPSRKAGGAVLCQSH